MPRTISRADAVAQVTELVADTDCLLCGMLRGDLGEPLWLERGEHASVLLPRYAVRWGHAMVVLHDHVTRFGALLPDAWAEATRLALATARVAERELEAERCYVASLGSNREDIPMTCPHLHLHVIPTYDVDARPSAVLTWEHGVVTADEQEWQQLRARYRRV